MPAPSWPCVISKQQATRSTKSAGAGYNDPAPTPLGDGEASETRAVPPLCAAVCRGVDPPVPQAELGDLRAQSQLRRPVSARRAGPARVGGAGGWPMAV